MVNNKNSVFCTGEDDEEVCKESGKQVLVSICDDLVSFTKENLNTSEKMFKLEFLLMFYTLNV